MPVAKGIHEAMTSGSWIRRMFERGTELRRLHGEHAVFDFTLGNPILEPPDAFFQTLERIAGQRRDGLHRYMPNAGFPEVRAAVAKKLRADGTFPNVQGEGVVMSVGAGGGLNVVLKTILDPDDEVVVFAPHFPEYVFYVNNHGGQAVVVETDARFNLDAEALSRRLSARTKAVIINSPNNPTGRLYPKASLDAVVAQLRDHEQRIGRAIYLISDEPYRDLVYVDRPPPSPAALHRSSFVVYSWSKSLSVPGERIGFVAVNPQSDTPKELTDGLTFATRTLGFVNAPATMQLAVRDLLTTTVDVGWYRQRRDRVVLGLRDLGLDVLEPEGAFYVFPKAPEPDDVRFVQRALDVRVLLVPGSGLGRSGYFRMCFSVDDRTMEGGLNALARLLGKGCC